MGKIEASREDDKRRLRPPRRDKGRIRLNPRDLITLAWIGEQYAVRFDSLQLLLGRSAEHKTHVAGQVKESTARRVVERWQQEKLVETRKYFYREPAWVALTAHGLRQLDLPYKVWPPKVGVLAHLHLVNRIRLHTEANYGAFRHWRGERRVRREHRGKTAFHVPDGEVVTHQDQVIAVEVERTLKSRRRIEQIIRRLAQHYARTWFFVTPATRAAITHATAVYSDQFQLYNLAQLPE